MPALWRRQSNPKQVCACVGQCVIKLLTPCKPHHVRDHPGQARIARGSDFFQCDILISAPGRSFKAFNKNKPHRPGQILENVTTRDRSWRRPVLLDHVIRQERCLLRQGRQRTKRSNRRNDRNGCGSGNESHDAPQESQHRNPQSADSLKQSVSQSPLRHQPRFHQTL